MDMKMGHVGRWVAALAAMGLCLSASAAAPNVVAWWSMNGDTAASLDSVPARGDDAGLLTAYPDRTYNGVVNASGKSAPFWTNAVGRVMGVLDPLTGTVHVETNAVRFIAKTLNGDAGLLRVPSQALRLSTFTFETFVRRDLSRTTDWQVIAVVPGSLTTPEGKTLKNCDSWGLRLTNPTSLSLRMTKESYTVDAGAQVVGSGQNKEYAAAINGAADGCWHHVAFSVDSEARQVKIYWDYACVKTETLANPIWYGSEDLFLGATIQTPGPLHGCLAQVRILDQAVGPESFLRFVRAEKGAGEADDVLFHYDFEPEDGLPASTFYNLATTGVGPAAVNLVQQGDEKYPLLVEADVPSAQMRPSYASSVSSTNNWSLANTYVDENKRNTGACVKHDMNGEDPFTNTSFTVECFYKSDGEIPLYTPFVRRRGGANIQFNLGVSGTTGTLAASYQKGNASNDGGAIGDTARTDDGQWHHAALVVDYENNVFRLYRDYQQRSSMSLGGLKLIPSSYPVCISGVEGSGNTFKGSVDDVRITMRALTSMEFLTSRPVVDTNPLAYVRFETNSLRSTSNPYLMQNATAVAHAGGQAPSFSDDVPGTRIREGEEGPVHVNAASLAFQKGVVKYASNAPFSLQEAQTIEFFVKLDAPPEQWASMVRCNKSGTDTTPVWALGFTDSAGQINLRYDLMVDGELTTSQGKGTINGGSKLYLNDRRWHHLAMAFEPRIGGGTIVRLWLDAGEPYVIEAAGDIHWGDGEANIWLGQIAASPSFIGKIDELRISKGVLDPSEFLRVEPTGTLVIFR